MRPSSLEMRAAIMAAFIAMASLAAEAQVLVRGKATVVDGDTIDINGARIRLHGIDAPETGQSCNDKRGRTYACGSDAVGMLTDLIGDSEVECSEVSRDNRFGRAVSVCRAGGRNLNSEMVARGHAWAFRQYSNAYVACETEARQRGVGIWQAQQAQAPWEYRRDVWSDALQVAPAGRPIKANFRRKGECIYHTPWSKSYGKLKVENMVPPNRWVATEEEALALGCRPAKEGRTPRRTRRLTAETVPSPCPM